MKLALCLEYPIDQHGGTEVLVSELIRGLGKQHRILLVSDDTEVSFAGSSVAPFVAEHIPWKPLPASVPRARELAQKIADKKPDLAHFHFGGSYAWGNRAFTQCPIVHLPKLGVPCLATNHGAFSIWDGYCGPQRAWWFKLALFLPAWLSKQYVIAHTQGEITVSMHDYHAVRRWYPLVRRKFRQIYHSRLHATAATPPATAERRKAILCVGTIGSRKGQPVLVEAFSRIAAKYPDWQLVLIGRGAEDPMMRQIHESLSRHGTSSQVQLLGARSDNEVEQWLDTAAIFAMPSFQEGLGLSLQEALFRGCACVGSRVGGVPDLIQQGDNGLLVEAGDAAELAGALEQLMSDKTLRSRLAARAKKSVLEKEMTAEKMIEKHQTLYENILKKV